MAMYLTRFSYTPETWARMIENPEDRREAARAYIESVGGKLHGFWYAFGEHDGGICGRRLTTYRWRLSPLPSAQEARSALSKPLSSSALRIRWEHLERQSRLVIVPPDPRLVHSSHPY